MKIRRMVIEIGPIEEDEDQVHAKVRVLAGEEWMQSEWRFRADDFQCNFEKFMVVATRNVLSNVKKLNTLERRDEPNA